MKITIDRFEEDMAVVILPDESVLNLPRKLFEDAKEGDVVEISVDRTETEERKKRIDGLMNSLFKK